MDDAQIMRGKLTGPQLLALQRANIKWLCSLGGEPRGLRRAAWTRMMNRLVTLGAVTPYLDGDYYLTPAGKRAAEL